MMSSEYVKFDSQCVRVRITFIDGTVMNLRPSEFDKAANYHFKLRPRGVNG